MTYHLGIDLGTTFTAAAVANGQSPTIVGLGNRAMQIPSVLYLQPDGDFLVGEAAERRAAVAPDRIAREFKRRLGDHVPMLVAGTPYSPQLLTSHLLRWVVATVAEREGCAPSRITVTHPAKWGGYRLELLDEIISLADVGPARTLPEPTAAALQYASQTRVPTGAKLAVYDLGGGTFDICLLEKRAEEMVILGTPDGVEQLGGIDFDEALFRKVLADLGPATRDLDVDDPFTLAALLRLRRDCVDAKESLSSDIDSDIPVNLPGIATMVRVTRPEFEVLIRPALQETINAVSRALRSAQLEPGDLHAIVLIGGSSRIPLVSELLHDTFAVPTALDTHPKHDVVLGAVRDFDTLLEPPAVDEAIVSSAEQPTSPLPTQPSSDRPTTELPPADDTAIPQPAAEVLAPQSNAEPDSEPEFRYDARLPQTEPETRPLEPAGPTPAGQTGIADRTPGEEAEPADRPATAAAAATSAAPPAGPPGSPQVRTPRIRKPRRAAVVLTAAGAAVAVLVAGLLLLNNDSPDGAGSISPTTPAVTTSPEPAAWSRVTGPPFATDSAGVAAVDGKLWAVGGFEEDGRTPRAAVQIYDPASDAWTQGPPLPAGRAFPTVVSFGTELLVIGGYSGSEAISEAFALSADRQSWRKLPSMPEPRHSGAAVHDGKRVVFAGGVDSDDQVSATAFAFDRSRWLTIGELKVPRKHLTAASPARGEVWFIGGVDADGRTPEESEQVLDGEDVTPFPAAAVVEPMDFAAAVPIDDNGTCLLGTRSPGDEALSWQCANTALTERLPPLEPARTQFGTAVIDNTLYVIGGHSGDGTPTNEVQTLDLDGFTQVPGTVYVALDATNADWAETEVVIEPGEQVSISALGRMSDNVGLPGRRFGPAGEIRDSPDRYKQFPHATLLGRIGEDGEPFAIGADKTLDDSLSDPGGPLYLLINDQSGLDNGGSYWVTIRRAS